MDEQRPSFYYKKMMSPAAFLTRSNMKLSWAHGWSATRLERNTASLSVARPGDRPPVRCVVAVEPICAGCVHSKRRHAVVTCAMTTGELRLVS